MSESLKLLQGLRDRACISLMVACGLAVVYMLVDFVVTLLRVIVRR